MNHDCAICGRDTRGEHQYKVGRHLYHWRCFYEREFAPAFKSLFRSRQPNRPGPKPHEINERKIKAI